MFVILSTDASGQKGSPVSLRISPKTQLTLEKEAQVIDRFLSLPTSH